MKRDYLATLLSQTVGNKPKKSEMKTIIKTFLLIITISCNEQKPHLTDEIIGDWVVVHIFQNGDEILDNNFEKTGWFPKYNRTKQFYIHQNNLNLYMNRHEKPILANISFNDSIFKISNSTDSRFNNKYRIEIKTDTVNQEGVKTAYYFLTLNSDKTKILAVKNKALIEKSY